MTSTAITVPDGGRFKIGTRPDGTRYLWEVDAQGRWAALIPPAEGSEPDTYRACTGQQSGPAADPEPLTIDDFAEFCSGG